MAFVHEIKFFKKDNELFSALFESPTRYHSECWIKNVPAVELGIEKLPENIALEQRYKAEELGVKPFFFYESVPKVEFVNASAESAWSNGAAVPIGSFTA